MSKISIPIFYCRTCGDNLFGDNRRKHYEKGVKHLVCKRCWSGLRRTGLKIEEYIVHRKSVLKQGLSCPNCDNDKDHIHGPKGRYFICRKCRRSFQTPAQKARAKLEREEAKNKLKRFREIQNRETESNRLRMEYRRKRLETRKA